LWKWIAEKWRKYHPRVMILEDPNPRAKQVEYTTLWLVYSYS
jgi:hypothetical protein